MRGQPSDRGESGAPALLLAGLAALFVCCLTPIAAGAVAVPPGLGLSPVVGPPGTEVTATTSGFDGCVEPQEVPEVVPSSEVDPRTEIGPGSEDDPPADGESSGEDPAVLGLGVVQVLDVGPTPGSVRISWDGTVLATVAVAEAADGVRFRVPEQASLGPHTVTAICAQDSKLQAAASFTVSSSNESPAPTSTRPGNQTDTGTDTGTERVPSPVDGRVDDARSVPASGTWWTNARWWILALLVAGAAGLVAARMVIRRRGDQWVHAHVRAVAHPVPQVTSSGPELTDDHPRGAHVVQLAPHRDPGTSVLEEV